MGLTAITVCGAGGARVSNSRSVLSEDTHERRFAVCGLNTALYVQLPTGSVSSERGDVGDHYHPHTISIYPPHPAQQSDR
jgi:hypothetical protein